MTAHFTRDPALGTHSWDSTLGGVQTDQFPNSASSFTITRPAVTGTMMVAPTLPTTNQVLYSDTSGNVTSNAEFTYTATGLTITKTEAKVIVKGGSATNGAMLHMDAAKKAHLWNSENTDLDIATNGVVRVTVAAASGVSFAGAVDITGATSLKGTVGFNNTAPIAKPTVTGSRGSNAALASLLTELANYGLIINSSS